MEHDLGQRSFVVLESWEKAGAMSLRTILASDAPSTARSGLAAVARLAPRLD